MAHILQVVIGVHMKNKSMHLDIFQKNNYFINKNHEIMSEIKEA